MAKIYRFSEKAKADLKGIWIYTNDLWGEQQAEKYYREIIKTIELLAAGDRQGRKEGVRAGYLKRSVQRHFVYFTAEGDEITVVRILHQSMDVDRHL